MSLFRIYLTVLSLVAPFQLNAETLNLLNWEAYLSEEIQHQWEQQSGNRIEIIYFDNDEKRDAILLNSKHNSIDIAVVDEVIAERFGKEGKLIKLTEENVPNLKHMGEFWRYRCGNYAMPYLWGTLGIVYRSDIVATPPTSWNDLLNPSEQLRGHIGMMDDYTDMLAPALFLHQHELNTEDPKAFKQAFASLKNQLPHVLTYDYVITFLQNSPNADELHMALAYGGDQYTINELQNSKGLWKYVIPAEGTVLWVDCLAITASSEHQQEALNLINYLNKPAIAAKNAEDLYYATPNDAATKLLSEEFRNDSEIFPEHKILRRSGLYEVLSNENIRQRLRITNAIINIHESQ
ncbi:spermidine/putrescine ABC transporter substrate-binding protein [Neptuniibacter sp.]|uniref:polyamine ABC transporter substrate-binding protein n=1 Tax=Neptuniibacter sp. TaxID=1962643 RepID=UPI00262053BC|nr:spermidine/putrescine ABC transporter substrate-binding protein [Neptuniibacter sp.]MCP4598812.1 spermidine/putrescine ABC transporter substrate-binding protein [Neptuniibacter sp.]